jgi:hypothetical protein
MRVTFEEVAIYSEKSVPCAGGCKRRLKRKKKFWQTLSPFNKKSRDEIYAVLREESASWMLEPETCSHCKAGKQAA